jgi:paraquat-inducible protein A
MTSNQDLEATVILGTGVLGTSAGRGAVPPPAPRLGILRALILADSALLGIGLCASCMTIFPGYGGFDALVKILAPHHSEPRSFSIVSGLLHLFQEGQWFIGGIIAGFSLLFPIWKLCVLWQSMTRLRLGSPLGKELHWVELLGKFSMLDIFVLALLVLAIKGLPGGTQVRIDWGMYCFFVSIILSMLVPKLLRKRVG